MLVLNVVLTVISYGKFRIIQTSDVQLLNLRFDFVFDKTEIMIIRVNFTEILMFDYPRSTLPEIPAPHSMTAV